MSLSLTTFRPSGDAIFFAFFVILLVISQGLSKPTTSSWSSTIAPKFGKRCTGFIFSLSDVAAAQECTTIIIGAFKVPAGETFSMSVPDGAQISLTGQVDFGVAHWAGPLFTLKGNNVTFNGNGNKFVGNGDQYWDGLGSIGGVAKPTPMVALNMGGTFENLVVTNSPNHAFSIHGNGDTLTISGVTVDNSAGDAANSKSAGQPAGRNTDGFDISGNNINIQNCIVMNQDDCVAINRGTGIIIKGNQCSGGHGISIGSIASGVTVDTVSITNNIVTNSSQALRIKTTKTSTGSTVSGVTYSGNKASGITRFGVIIDQSYPSTLGTPGTGVKISDVIFSGTNTISVGSFAHRVEVNCGRKSHCGGTWDFSGLTVNGGSTGVVKNAPVSGGSF